MDVRFVPHTAYNLTDDEWRTVETLIPIKTGTGTGPGKPRTLDMRQVVNALLYLEQTGCQWRHLPGEFPNHNSVRYYFDVWRKDGTWNKIRQALHPYRQNPGYHQDNGNHRVPGRPAINRYAFGDR